MDPDDRDHRPHGLRQVRAALVVSHHSRMLDVECVAAEVDAAASCGDQVAHPVHVLAVGQREGHDALAFERPHGRLVGLP